MNFPAGLASALPVSHKIWLSLSALSLPQLQSVSIIVLLIEPDLLRTPEQSMCHSNTMCEPLLLSPDTPTLFGRKRSRAQCTVEPSTKKRRVIKTVRFAAFATQYESVSNVNTWYTADEQAAFKENIKRDVFHIAALCQEKRINELDRTEYSPIGLEKYCCSIAEQEYMKSLRVQCTQAVFYHQLIQRQMGLNMPEPIREVSQLISTPAVNKALARASKLCRRNSY